MVRTRCAQGAHNGAHKGAHKVRTRYGAHTGAHQGQPNGAHKGDRHGAHKGAHKALGVKGLFANNHISIYNRELSITDSTVHATNVMFSSA